MSGVDENTRRRSTRLSFSHRAPVVGSALVPAVPPHHVRHRIMSMEKTNESLSIRKKSRSFRNARNRSDDVSDPTRMNFLEPDALYENQENVHVYERLCCFLRKSRFSSVLFVRVSRVSRVFSSSLVNREFRVFPLVLIIWLAPQTKLRSARNNATCTFHGSRTINRCGATITK